MYLISMTNKVTNLRLLKKFFRQPQISLDRVFFQLKEMIALISIISIQTNNSIR